MAFQVTWTDPAAADLEGIVQDLSEINEEAATRLGRSILSHVGILAVRHGTQRDLGPGRLLDRTD